MQIETAFSNGDKVFVIGGDHQTGPFPFKGTVGMVRVQVIDSPGRPGEDLFHNFMPQSDYKEEYMLVERGIGSGNLYTLGENIFATKEECEAAIKNKEES